MKYLAEKVQNSLTLYDYFLIIKLLKRKEFLLYGKTENLNCFKG